MELDDRTADQKAAEIWAALGIDPDLRDQVVRSLEKLRVTAEQAMRAKGTREERFVKRLLSFAAQRGKPDDQGYRYFLIWYAKSHGERGAGRRRGKKSSAPPSATSQRVAALLRTRLEDPELQTVDAAIKDNWAEVHGGNSAKQMAAAWRKLFIGTYLTDEERDEYKDLIKSVLPPIYLQRRSWRHRHEAATSCLMQWLLIGAVVLTAQSQTSDVPYNENKLPVEAPQPAGSAGAAHSPPASEELVPDAAQQDELAIERDNDSLPRDARTNDAGSCDSDKELVLEGEYLAWDSHEAHFCGSFGTVFQVRGASASASTLPNGRFEIRLPNAPVVLLDVTPSPEESRCNSANGFYVVPTIAVASRNVICAGGRWVGREFLGGARPYDPGRAFVLVHISGPPRAVSITAAHGQTRIMDSGSWVPGAMGRDVFFPEVDPTQGQTKVIADDAIAPDSIPLVAGTMTEVTIVTGHGVR